MAESDSQATWQQVTKLALSIVAVVGIVVVPKLPLSVTRPNVAPPAENRFVSAQSVDARLWQDPFEAVDAEREKRRPGGRADSSAPPPNAQGPRAATGREQSLREQLELKTERSATPLVLLTFVPGGPYPENAESRRRMRYATLSGLRASGLMPEDAEHIGYVEIGRHAGGLPPLAVYEWLHVAKSRNSARLGPVLILWLDERVYGNAVIRKTAALLRELEICNATARRVQARLVMLGPAESGSVRSLAEEVGGAKPSDVACLSQTLVLSTATVPDEYLMPRSAPDGLVMHGPGPGLAELLLASADLRFVRVLPTDDALIQELNEELTARKAALRAAPPTGVNPKLDAPGPAANLRLDAPRTRVAIVSEWDTLYGRRGVELVSNFVCGQQGRPDASGERPRASWCDGRVQLFEYPRGLDGVIPGRDAKKPGDAGDKSARLGFQRDADPGERAEGSSQVDYLRRLAAELDRLVSNDTGTSWGNEHPLVIGVLGSDVYDKLLILQALKPQHPQATFFTFDLDARMLHRDEFNWARNLLVIAPLGLRLRPELQASIPPFRDTYQTAYFLSARMAVARARREARAARDESWGLSGDTAEPIVRAAWRPRVFEIGRGQEFDLSVVEGGARRCRSALDCPDVTPAPPSFGLAFSTPDWWWVASVGLVGVTLLVFSSAVRDALNRSFAGRRRRLAWAAALACAVGISFLFVRFGVSWLEEARPEPFSWDGGVSMWPTEIIRAATLLLTLVFSVVAARAVRGAARAMEAQYSLEPGEALSAGQAAASGGGVGANGHLAWARPGPERPHGGGWQARWDAITLRGFDRIARREPADSILLWAEYRRQSQGWRRNVRVALTMVLALGVVVCFMQYFGRPRLPARGEVIRLVDFLLVFVLSTPVVLWLQMYVVDVIRLCDKVTSALASERPTAWPAGARERFWSSSSPAATGPSPDGVESLAGAAGGSSPSRTAVAAVATVPRAATSTASATDEDASYWLDIQFTADWTARVSWLVYLPLVVICLMMVARGRFFDDWDTPPGLYAGFGLSLVYLVGCVGVLMRRANLLRGNALRHLRARMRRLTGSGGGSAELDRVKVMIQDVERADEGAFAPLTRQPIFGALAVMFGGAGITAVIQYLMGVR